MARYEYKCNNCNIIETVTKPMKEASREEKCSKCDTTMQRIYNATPNQWKCSGAYVTDSK